MDLDPFDIPPFDQSTFRFSIPSGILPSITAVIRLRNRLTELDNVLDLHREFDTSCEDIGIWEDNCESHLDQIYRAINRLKEEDDLARSQYEVRDLIPGIPWWNSITLVGKAVEIQTQWLEGPALRMYEGHGLMRKDLVRRELVDKLKTEFEFAGDWKPFMKEGVERMISEMAEYARDKRKVVQ